MEEVTRNYLQTQHQNLKAEYQAYAQKLSEMEAERKEHALVISTLQKLPNERRCYRLVGGVLVERTVGEVVPAVSKNLESIEKVVSNLEEAMDKKRKDIDEFVAKYTKPKQ
mmetsp:Transcript_694/g.1048  ORF Transcript_694/g.1048 Transcript_694/m.1048 type:complete len:111 (-) Transcript_694:117-449(-)